MYLGYWIICDVRYVLSFKKLFATIFTFYIFQLVCHSHYWPDWVNRTVFSKVEWLTRTYTTRQFTNSERLRLVTGTIFLKNSFYVSSVFFVSGMLLKQIADRMHAQPLMIQKNETRLKFFAYSAVSTGKYLFSVILIEREESSIGRGNICESRACMLGDMGLFYIKF